MRQNWEYVSSQHERKQTISQKHSEKFPLKFRGTLPGGVFFSVFLMKLTPGPNPIKISEQNMTLWWYWSIRLANIDQVTDLIDWFHCSVKYIKMYARIFYRIGSMIQTFIIRSKEKSTVVINTSLNNTTRRSLLIKSGKAQIATINFSPLRPLEPQSVPSSGF